MYIDLMKLLPKKFKISSLTSGFTLVELLVVIGVLGILAAGLLATVDPLEQFRKASDSNKQQTALELVNAIQRYYANHGAFPWDVETNGGNQACYDSTGNAGVSANKGVEASTASGNTGFADCLGVLVSEGELKATFPTQYSILRYLYVRDDSASDTSKSMRVCYAPESKSQQQGPLAKWDKTDTSAACDGTDLTNHLCWVCGL